MAFTLTIPRRSGDGAKGWSRETLEHIRLNSRRGFAVNLHGDERCDHLHPSMVGAEPSSDEPTAGAEMQVFSHFKT